MALTKKETEALIETAFLGRRPTWPKVTATVLSIALPILGAVVVEVRFQTKTDDRLSAIEIILAPQRALQASATPDNRTSQDEAKKVLAESIRTKRPIPQSIVREAGDRFISAAETNPKAWDVALDFVSYWSSIINAKLPDEKLIQPWATHVVISPVGKAAPRTFESLERVPISQAARAEIIGFGASPFNKTVITGPARIYLEGGVVTLDGMFLFRAMLIGVEVHYAGQQVFLKDVVFLNCTFVLDNNPAGRKLGETLLASVSSTDFKQGELPVD